MKVRCIDNCKTWNYLITGKIYEVERETNNFYYWNGNCYPKWMFEEVKEPAIVSSRIKSTLRTWPFYFIDTIHTTIINGIEYDNWYSIPLSIRNTIPTEKYMVVYNWLIANVMPVEKESKQNG